MFRKIISNLPFSPALVGQLGFYAKRLKKEETTRRLGLIFIALALVVQSLAVFQPSESANASSLNDMVTGGITSINDYLSAYDSNTKNLKDTINYIGITRAEIAAAKYTEIEVGKRLSWGFVPHFSYEQGERQYNITDTNGQTITTAYSRPLKLWDNSTYYVRGWVGYSQSIGWFGIMRACGNLVTNTAPSIPTPTPIPTPEPTPEPIPEPTPEPTPEPKKCAVNSSLLASDQNCKTCPGDESIWINDSSCVPNLVKSKTSKNLSQGAVDASTIAAKASDRISYTITINNTGLNSTIIELKDNLSDVLEYTTLIDNGGGVLNATSKVLSWPKTTIAPKSSQSKSYTVQIIKTLPFSSSAQDCAITNAFGNSITIKINCPVQPKKCVVNPSLLASDENCKSCSGNETLWFKDSSCKPNIIKSKTATNSSQGFIKASKVTAKSGDRISYTVTIENSGLSSTTSKFEDNILDVLEYSTLIDNGGGTLNEVTGVLSWSEVTLKPKDKQTRTYTVKILEDIPLTARGSSNDTSYDCKITNTFGNSIEINVDCPTPKIIEKVAAELPKTGPTENMVFIGIVLSVATYFYTRTRQVKKEIRLIRRDTSAGTI